MADGIITADEKQVASFEDVSLHIAPPSLSEGGMITFHGNFTETKGRILSVVERYKDVALDEGNVTYVRTLKRQFASLRNNIERERKEYTRTYIQSAKDLVDSMCNELLQAVSRGESVLSCQLDEYDKQRKEELKGILTAYSSSLADRHGLREEYRGRIEIKEKYFNRTQKESDSIKDIESQVLSLLALQNRHDDDVKVIERKCAEVSLLPSSYVRSLEYKEVSLILLEIDEDAKRSKEIAQEKEQTGKVVLGQEITEELKKAVSFDSADERTRTRVLRVTYTACQAKTLAGFFKESGIKFEFLDDGF